MRLHCHRSGGLLVLAALSLFAALAQAGEFEKEYNFDCQELVVLDMIGEANLRVPREAYSERFAPDWTASVFQRAGQLGLPAFVDEPGPGVYDDHVPFLGRGIPAVDLIDFDFPEWHTIGDVPEVCSPASLEQVGRLMVSLIYQP